MSHKTLGNLISWSFVAGSAVCLLGALLLAIVQPSADNLLLVTSCGVGLNVTAWLAMQD